MKDHPDRSDDFPHARTRHSWVTRLIWLVPLVASAFVAWIIYTNVIGAGPTIHVFFTDAEGLEPGNSAVKFRGATVGRVNSIQITDDQKQVDVELKLDKSASKVARSGSEFWIVKPELSASEIRGLRTIVSGSYIGVRPGKGKEQTEFQGVPEPVAVEQRNRGTEYQLLSANLGSTKPGTPILFRGIQVGEVADYALGPKSQLIQLTIDIRKEYAPLVRLNTKFWNAGGINLDVGLNGLDISAESFKSLIGGAIAFNTPDQPGEVAPGGTAFRLYEKPADEWLKWLPEIPLQLDHTTHIPRQSETTHASK
ncbi:MAG: intermembrane transport protein PqiB [Verrucomicrobiota bacterium]